jgi:GNAT superfamily N-acetyltransferase
MLPSDADAVLDVMNAAFADLDIRLGRPAPPSANEPGPGLVRIRHLIGTDPGGAWVADDGGDVVGAALALVREGIWGLSLLVVQPGRQSTGTGSALLRAALDHGSDARGGIILASEDPRALRAYARAGFELRPAFDVRGRVQRRPPRPVAVRDGRWPQDGPLVDAVGRAVRGAAHGGDVQALLAGGASLSIHEEAGFAVWRGATLRLLAARGEAVAAELLRAFLAAVPGDEDVDISFITQGQDWAVRVVLEAGLELRPGGAVFVRGDVGPMRPYLPSGSYL